MKKIVSLLLCLFAITSMFAFIPDAIHITDYFPILVQVGQAEQIQVCTSGSYEWYGEIISEDDTVIIDTVIDWNTRKAYSIEYTEDGEEVDEYHELTFNEDFLVTQDIWIDCDGELILDYEYAPDYSSYKCYATEEDERYLWDEYFIKKTSTGYAAFYRDYYRDGDIYAASKFDFPLPYFYDRTKKEMVDEVYCMKYGIEKVQEIEYYDSNTIDTVYDFIFSNKSYVKIDNDYDEKYEYFFDDSYDLIREVEYYAIDDPDIYWDTRYITEKDSSGRIISEKYYDDVSDYDYFNPNTYSPDEELIIKYPNNGLKKLDRPTSYYGDYIAEDEYYDYEYYDDDYYYEDDYYWEDDYYEDDYYDDDYYL